MIAKDKTGRVKIVMAFTFVSITFASTTKPSLEIKNGIKQDSIKNLKKIKIVTTHSIVDFVA